MISEYRSIFDVASQTWKLVLVNPNVVVPPTTYPTKPGDIVIFGTGSEIKDSGVNINQEPGVKKTGGYFA